jgi:hypothetical protein
MSTTVELEKRIEQLEHMLEHLIAWNNGLGQVNQQTLFAILHSTDDPTNTQSSPM